MIAHWGDWMSRRGKSKEKMVYYCMQVWSGKQIRRDHLYWPIFGSFEDWICQALNIYVNSKEPFSLEESEYASLWIRSDTTIHVFTLREKNSKKKRLKVLKRSPFLLLLILLPHRPQIPLLPLRPLLLSRCRIMPLLLLPQSSRKDYIP